MKTRIILTTLLLALAFTACDDESTQGGYPVYFKYTYTYPLTLAEGAGQFIVIEREGLTAFNVTYYEGAAKRKKKIELSEWQLKEGAMHYGLGGLILGRPAAFDGNRWAYDLACPKCKQGSRKLTVELEGGIAHAHCKACACKFDLNNGGYAIEGNAKRPLFRYNVHDYGSDIVIVN